MDARLAYFYAQIDPEDNMCIGVMRTSTSTDHLTDTSLVPIPVYDEEYCFKYYINGNWYEDAEGTIPWTSSLL